MRIREHGRIQGGESGLMPCVWLGVSQEDTFHVASDRAPKITDPLALVPGAHEKPGRFVFEHQYDGTACSHVTLSGAILPLASCNDRCTAGALEALTRLYFDNPFRTWWPNLDELIRLRSELTEIGPLDFTDRFRGLGEAYLTFSLGGRTYTWLAERFQMVTSIEDNEDDRPVSIKTTSALPKDLETFIEWMSYPGHRCYPNWLHGALLYENSD
jgi:hypothetical protein